jgi:hypothetical protein
MTDKQAREAFDNAVDVYEEQMRDRLCSNKYALGVRGKEIAESFFQAAWSARPAPDKDLIALLQNAKDDMVWLLSGHPTQSEQATLAHRIREIEDAVVAHNLASTHSQNMGGASETGIGNHASTAHQQDHALTPPATQNTGAVDEKPTEAMCDAARGFIMGLDLNIRTWKAMQIHLNRGGYPTLSYIQTKAISEPSGHITKWDVADCIYQLMQTKAALSAAPSPDKVVVSLNIPARALKVKMEDMLKLGDIKASDCIWWDEFKTLAKAVLDEAIKQGARIDVRD